MMICRFCKKHHTEDHKYKHLFVYGPRHNAHADCGLKAKGSDFLHMIGRWQLLRFPYLAAEEAGYLEELKKLIAMEEDRAFLAAVNEKFHGKGGRR